MKAMNRRFFLEGLAALFVAPLIAPDETHRVYSFTPGLWMPPDDGIFDEVFINAPLNPIKGPSFYWVGGSGSWDDPKNWKRVGIAGSTPGPCDLAVIDAPGREVRIPFREGRVLGSIAVIAGTLNMGPGVSLDTLSFGKENHG